MVKTLGRALAILCLVLPLSSCIFFFSAFSPLLTQVVARADLSAVIPAGAAMDYRIYCVSYTYAAVPPSGEFVLLMNTNATQDPRVIVLDGNLNFIQAYTSATLSQPAWNPGFTGMSIMADALGRICVGNSVFDATELQNIGPGYGPSWTCAALMGPSFCSPFLATNTVSFQTSGNTLSYSKWDAMFTSSTGPVTLAIQAVAGTQFNIDGVYNVDDSPTGGWVILALGEQGSSTIHFMRIPRADLNTTAGPTSPLFDNYPHASYSNLDSSSVGFAGDCLVAYSYQDHALVRYSLTPPFGVLSTLPVGQGAHQITYAYKADGSYSVQLDQSTRMLTKVARWW